MKLTISPFLAVGIVLILILLIVSLVLVSSPSSRVNPPAKPPVVSNTTGATYAPMPVCGNGRCEEGESDWNCEDCAACGDGQCSCLFESKETCQSDCHNASATCIEQYNDYQDFFNVTISSECPQDLADGTSALTVNAREDYSKLPVANATLTVYRLISTTMGDPVTSAEINGKACIILKAGTKYYLEALGDMLHGTYGDFDAPIVLQNRERREITLDLFQIVY